MNISNRVQTILRLLLLMPIITLGLAGIIGSSSGGGGGDGISTDDALNAVNPQVAVDGSGNGIAVWVQEDRVGNHITFNIWVRHYSAGSGADVTKIANIATTKGLIYTPRIAMDANGNGTVVWEQDDGGIRAMRYDAGTGSWGPEEQIGFMGGGGSSSSLALPQLAMSAGGNTIVVWERGDTDVYANHYDATTGSWGSEELIETSSQGLEGLKVAMDAIGNAIAVWQYVEEIVCVNFSCRFIWGINSRRYDTAVGNWGLVKSIEAGSETAENPQIAMNASGKAITVWHQDDGVTINIYATHYDSATGIWGTAQLIETLSEIFVYPQITMNATGDAIAVWQKGGTLDIYANHYDAATGMWGTAQLIETLSENVISPRIAINSVGNGIAIWGLIDSDVYSNCYDTSLGWRTEEQIGTTTFTSGIPNEQLPLHIAMDGFIAIAVWEYIDLSSVLPPRQIHEKIWFPPSCDAPQNVQATAGYGQVTISWSAVTGATSYNLYWNTAGGVTTADSQISSVTSPYDDTGLSNGTTYYYIVTAVTATGEGAPSAEVSATPMVIPTYNVGGAVSGLTGGTLVLRNNGGDDLTVTANGSFTFVTPVADGSVYDVTVFTQPAGHTCSVSNGSGVIPGADETSVAVTCSATLQYTLKVSNYSIGGAGKVTINPGSTDCLAYIPADCQVDFNDGTVVILTAIPSPGGTFLDQWGNVDGASCVLGVDSSGNSTCTITIDGNKDILALWDFL